MCCQINRILYTSILIQKLNYNPFFLTLFPWLRYRFPRTLELSLRSPIKGNVKSAYYTLSCNSSIGLCDCELHLNDFLYVHIALTKFGFWKIVLGYTNPYRYKQNCKVSTLDIRRADHFLLSSSARSLPKMFLMRLEAY